MTDEERRPFTMRQDRWKERAVGDEAAFVGLTAPVASRSLARIASDRSILNRARRDVDPPTLNEHFDARGFNSVLRWAAIRPVAAAPTGFARQLRIDVVRKHRHRLGYAQAGGGAGSGD